FTGLTVLDLAHGAVTQLWTEILGHVPILLAETRDETQGASLIPGLRLLRVPHAIQGTERCATGEGQSRPVCTGSRLTTPDAHTRRPQGSRARAPPGERAE